MVNNSPIIRRTKEYNMSEEAQVQEPVESTVDVSNEPISTEIGSGVVEDQVIEDSQLATEQSTEDAAEIDAAAEEIQEAIEDGATEDEIKEMVETFKLKVNGKEKEVTLDWNNKDDIVRRLQMAEAAPKAMQDKAELESFYRQEIERLAANPWEVLEELGLNPDELAEARIQAQIEQLQRTPEQIADDERQSEIEELREKLKTKEENEEKMKFDKLQQQAEVDLEKEITEAISSTNELPKVPYVMKRVADALMWSMDQKNADGSPTYPDVSASDVIPTVQKEINDEFRELLEAMSNESLAKYIGSNTVERLRKMRLKKMPKNLSNVADTGKRPALSKEAKAKQSLRDFMKNGIK